MFRIPTLAMIAIASAGCAGVLLAMAPQPAPSQPVQAQPAEVPGATAPVDGAPGASSLKFEIIIDTTLAPEVAEWGETARATAEEWYPKLCEYLHSEGFTPREKVRIVFDPEYKGVAAASGGTIRIAPAWIIKHPGDVGMVVHELTHVVQSYPRNRMGWLVEGIADYTRFWIYEPQTRQRPIDVERASYRDSYRTSAAFLAWLVAERDAEIVKKLNARLRAGTCTEGTFEELLGVGLDALWAEFLAAQAAAQEAARESKKPAGE